MLALPRTRTSTYVAESAVINENVGTTAHLGLHNFFDNVTSPVTVALPLRPPAVANSLLMSSSQIQKPRNPVRNQQVANSGNQVASTRATLVRALAQPLALPETLEGHERGILRSHPSLLGVAGTVARVRPSSAPPPSISACGGSATNPILVDEGVGSSSVAGTSNGDRSRPLFQPRFTPSDRIQVVPRASSLTPLPSQTCASSRDILSSAIFDRCINSAQVSPDIVQALKKSSRFKNLLKDLLVFIRTVESSNHSRAQSVLPSDDHSPKRRKLNQRSSKVPAIIQGSYPQLEGAATPDDSDYFEEWKTKQARKLMTEFVCLLQEAQNRSNKGNQVVVDSDSRRSQSLNSEGITSKSKSKKRKSSGADSVQRTDESSMLGIDQLWNILRDFNADRSISIPPSEVTPSRSPDPQSAYAVYGDSMMDAVEDNRMTIPIEKENPEIVDNQGMVAGYDLWQGTRHDQPSLDTDFDKGALYDFWLNVDVNKILEEMSVETGLPTPLEGQPCPMPDLTISEDAFNNLTLDKSTVEDFDFVEFADMIEAMEPAELNKQLNEFNNADFGVFEPALFTESSAEPSNMAGATIWDGMDTHSSMDLLGNPFFDWRGHPLDHVYPVLDPPPQPQPPPLPHSKDTTSYPQTQPPIHGSHAFQDTQFSSISTIHQRPRGSPLLTVRPIPSQTGKAPIPAKGATNIQRVNPSVIRKRAVLARVDGQKEKIRMEMEEIKKTLWNLTIEGSVLRHIKARLE